MSELDPDVAAAFKRLLEVIAWPLMLMGGAIVWLVVQPFKLTPSQELNLQPIGDVITAGVAGAIFIGAVVCFLIFATVLLIVREVTTPLKRRTR